jgi:hypothetical protein
MNNDFDTPGALNVLIEFADELARVGPTLNQETKTEFEATFRSLAGVLGLLS